MVNEINSPKEKWSLVGMLIREVRNMMGKVAHWLAKHVTISMNVVAHVLANNTLEIPEERILLEEIPLCIQSLP